MKSKRTVKDIESLFPRIKGILQKTYGNRLVDIFLYGSFAKNNARMESDIDIAVVLEGEVNKSKEIDKIYDVLYDLILESGELISIFPLSDNEIKNSIWPLYYHIRKEGIKI
ncbi:MAG: nucleotidyltransferase domain-containing protein [Thermoplasmata archaeon]|nr:nucleotidyltransferase domain-containing protein [Thermoplasmata archaeon]